MASPVLRTVSSYDYMKCFRVLWEDGDLEWFILIKAWLATDPLSLSFKMSFHTSSSLQSPVRFDPSPGSHDSIVPGTSGSGICSFLETSTTEETSP